MGRSQVETILTDSVRFGLNPPSPRIPPTRNGSNSVIQFRRGPNRLSSRIQLNSTQLGENTQALIKFDPMIEFDWKFDY
jgi:hypothetical protein